MDVLHHYLKSVKASGLRNLNLTDKSLSHVLAHDPVASCEKCQYILYEVLLILVQFIPIMQILNQIDLLRSPETSHRFLVHAPDILVFYREQNVPTTILHKQRLTTQTNLFLALSLRHHQNLLTLHFIYIEFFLLFYLLHSLF